MIPETEISKVRSILDMWSITRTRYFKTVKPVQCDSFSVLYKIYIEIKIYSSDYFVLHNRASFCFYIYDKDSLEIY